jgi:hypothetical protein
MVSCRRLKIGLCGDLSKNNKPIFNRRQVANLPYTKKDARLIHWG